MTDRLAVLLASTTLNGIDFVEISTDAQTELAVHFLTTVTVEGTLTGAVPVTITGGESIPTVPVTVGVWTEDDEGRPVLALTTPFAGDFSTYTLAIASPALDVYYSRVPFSFKARCPSDLDCAPPCEVCPPIPGAGPAIDYLSKDFASFRQALLDYSAVAYPDWVERSEADLGMMLLELISSVGDDLSYLQDRVAAEASLATATQRRSIVRHARLVDYEPRPATSARVTVQLDVIPGTTTVPRGGLVFAATPEGGRIFYELGDGMIDPDSGELASDPLVVDARLNRRDAAGEDQLLPYIWDDSQRCLAAGSVTMWVAGHDHGFVAGDPQTGAVGTTLLIDTDAASPIDPPIRELIQLTAVLELTDVLLGDAPVTRIDWSPGAALSVDHDLTRTRLAGNLLAATEGRRYAEQFVIEPVVGQGLTPPAAVVRAGPRECCVTAPVYLHMLAQGRLAWLAPVSGADGPVIPGDSDAPLPEIAVTQLPEQSGDPETPWRWRRRLLDAPLYEDAFTVDPVAFIDLRSAGDPLAPQLWEYDGDSGDSVRFGDDVFGNRPAPQSRFSITYRVTQGAAGNAAADSITGVDPSLAALVGAATNPFPAAGGAAQESADEVRGNAPYAFRALQLRAVRPEDYDAAAQQLPWVLDAGTVFRWTGSWLTVFTTAQAQGTEIVPVDDEVALIELLNRRRLAGYEVYSPQPIYVSIDLIVTVCAQSTALRGEVEAGLLAALGTGRTASGAAAFFAPDRFRFGQPLERSELESAAQAVPGVDGVTELAVRRRGQTETFGPMPETVTVPDDAIVRCDNDPSEPERGSLRIVVMGGR